MHSLFKKLLLHHPELQAEVADLNGFVEPPRTYPPGAVIGRNRSVPGAVFVISDGWVLASHYLANGASQVVDIRLPGDFLYDQGNLGSSVGLEYVAVTEVRLREFRLSTEALLRATSIRLASAMMAEVTRDRQVITQHLVNVGRRDPAVRTAHMLLELAVRAEKVGLGDAHRFRFPLTQSMLADALGMSAIHLNRVLRKLRESKLVSFQNSMVTFEDFDAITRFAGFERGYLE
ncbi:Crp/Fnr family transcriptional regulator [Oceaniglobus roseus]|uniref:Crp/Fnr family transcriptional regulator n=1 Tax=Oceaniglobus roseus TaxID=1737570 RepID=UPI000C7E8ABD|nr:Crp/Fnr family transcriptional regulator [Kandeliimicrobium roseum]